MSNLTMITVYRDVYDKLNAILSDCESVGDNPIDKIQDFMCDIDNYLAEESKNESNRI